ncbi:hypothetical protein XGA_4710 [Xanthomonas hortorum ATCC 19865]|nr:hypothetical protein XGA_4710 [Xanthomonas hortorum ATCC 19865]
MAQAIDAIAMLNQHFATALEQRLAADDVFCGDSTRDGAVAQVDRFGAKQHGVSGHDLDLQSVGQTNNNHSHLMIKSHSHLNAWIFR